MEQEVLSFIDRHQLIQGPATILVGVSGGPDSMALLHFLNRHKKKLNINLIALSIDHQLRGEVSHAEGEYVEGMCKQWSIPFVQMDIDVKSYIKKNKTSQQTASREARYDAYEKMLKKTHAKYLALGHHADDQVETMVMALTKVTRPEVLSGIPLKRPFNESEIIRPFLSVNKDMIQSYCKMYDINPRYDASNEDLYYERNYFRKKIVPLLQERNPSIYKTAQIMSENLQEDNDYLNKDAQVLFDSLINKQNKTLSFILDIQTFHKNAKPLQRRVYKLILDYLYINERSELSYEHEAIFMKLMNGDVPNQILDFPLGLKLEKSYENIFFYFQTDDEKEVVFHQRTLNVEETLVLHKNRCLSSSLIEDSIHPKSSNPNVYFFEKDSVKLPLRVRMRRQGDRISWQGLNGSKKVKDVLIDKKVPRIKRDELLIVTDDEEELLWVVGLIKGLPKKSVGTGPYIKLEYEEF